LKISDSSNLNQVSQNHIQGGVEISRGSSSNKIFYNDISSGGILLEHSANSNKISKNNITNSEFGVYIIDCRLNTIKTNNFINNNIQAYFEDDLIMSILPDFWRRNYWDDWNGNAPKRIEGKIYIHRFSMDPEYQPPLIIKPWTNFDWFPARKPYNIPI
jgi:parallel beta-helix repeat protein